MKTKKTERICKPYSRGTHCADGREHCFNCGRHLNPETSQCPRGCGEGDDVNDDNANNEEE